jgi:ABC-type ATPase involved in cell division
VVAAGATVVVSAHDPLRSSSLSPRTLTLAGGLVVGDDA